MDKILIIYFTGMLLSFILAKLSLKQKPQNMTTSTKALFWFIILVLWPIPWILFTGIIIKNAKDSIEIGPKNDE